MKLITDFVSKIVNKGENIIYYINVGKNQVGFLEALYTYSAGDSEITLDIDGELINIGSIGSYQNPYKFEPPIVFFKYLKIIVFAKENNTRAEARVLGFITTK